MKWSFEQKLAWAKSYMAGELVPIPEDFSGSMKRWHDKVRRWVRVLLEYGEDGLNPSRQTRSFSPEAKLVAVKHRASNAGTEGVNSKIQKAITRSRSYRNVENAIRYLMFYCSHWRKTLSCPSRRDATPRYPQ